MEKEMNRSLILEIDDAVAIITINDALPKRECTTPLNIFL